MTKEVITRGAFFELPFPPSVNTYWRHWQGRTLISARGREYRAQVRGLVMAQKNGPEALYGPLAVHLRAWLPDRRSRDVDNLAKAPLDALTHAGVWQDDGQIVDLRITKQVSVKPGKLQVWIREV